MSKLVLLRHATAIKNLEDRHGGEGSTLSSEAINEINIVIEMLVDYDLSPKVVYHSPVPQARETVRLIQERTLSTVIEDQRLKPLHLGVLAGLSRNEAKSKYPGPAKLMEEWREGKIELHELIIPGAEDYKAFYRRGQLFLDSIKKTDGNILIVGTRSILILLMSILLGRTIEPGGGYREIPVENGWFFTFNQTRDGYLFKPKISNLGDKVRKELSL